ncbi:MAG: diguanylate cyclase [Chloroflexota bacterium]|nr:diguanylate cyclase [Chloroflexota bacterium]
MKPEKELKVLLVDDDILAIETTRHGIKCLGHTVVGEAINGKQAVEMAQSLQPDVILMDLKMPDIHGIEATRRIYQTCPTPVVMLTAYDTPKMLAQASEAGVGAYLLKSSKMAAVERAITIAIARFDDLMALRNLNQNLHNEIIQRKLAEKKQEKAQNYLKGSIESSLVGILLLDKQGDFIYVNPTILKWLDLKREYFIGKTFNELSPPIVSPETKHLITEEIEKHIQTGEAITGMEVEIISKAEKHIPVICSVARIKGKDGDVLGGIVHVTDITKRVQAEQALEYMANHDVLTNLPNRRLFNNSIKLEMAHAHRNQQKLGVMLFDLDHFKKVNDSLGHRAGDQLLQIVGERLTKLMRESDTIARMGGDEFMLLLPEMVRSKDAADTARRVMQAIRKPFVLDGHEVNISTSVGIAIYPDDGEDVDTLMKHADIAMYRAKDRGRDNCQFYNTEDE